MPKILTDDQITFYRENGYLAPLCGVDPVDTAAMCDDLEAFERDEGVLASSIVVKGHLCFRRSYEFSRHPRNSRRRRRSDRSQHYGAVVSVLDEAG